MSNKKISTNELSPYDESFPIQLLSEAFEFQMDKVNTTTKTIYDEIIEQVGEFADIAPIKEDKSRFVVDISDDTFRDIKKGKIKLVEENHQLYAQLRENGKYSKKLPIKEETFNNDEFNIYMLELKAMQETLEHITKQLNDIDESVRDIIKGQQNDRIGLYYSGISMYIESTYVNDSNMRKSLLSQSIKSLTDAIFQLTLSMQSDIRYLKNKEYESKKKNRTKLIDEKMKHINQCFSVIHQAQILKAAIYCKEGEVLAMCSVLDEYSRFIEGTIAKNATLLSQCDVYDNGTKFGTWKSRASLKLDSQIITKQLQNKNKVMYLYVREDKTDESI